MRVKVIPCGQVEIHREGSNPVRGGLITISLYWVNSVLFTNKLVNFPGLGLE
jgi:hypothetical protein